MTLDDDGNAVLGIQDGPPPMFPPMTRMPPPPELTERDEALLKYRRQLSSAWRNSCYFLDKEPEQSKHPEVTIEHYSDRRTKAAKAGAAEKTQLSQLLTLNARYFPVELHGGRGRRKRRRNEDDDPSIWRVPEGHATQDISRLDRLARLEKRMAEEEEKAAQKGGGVEGEGAGAGAGGKDAGKDGKDGKDGKGGEDGEGDEEEGEEEDYWDDDDDYQQGGAFDDDDGYDDDFADDDGEAYF